MSTAQLYNGSAPLGDMTKKRSSAPGGHAAKQRRGRKQALPARHLVLVVVLEVECAVPQLQQRNVCRRADPQRPAILEDWKDSRRGHRGTGHDSADRHAEGEPLGHAVWKIDDASRAAARVPVRRNRVGPEALL